MPTAKYSAKGQNIRRLHSCPLLLRPPPFRYGSHQIVRYGISVTSTLAIAASYPLACRRSLTAILESMGYLHGPTKTPVIGNCPFKASGRCRDIIDWRCKKRIGVGLSGLK